MAQWTLRVAVLLGLLLAAIPPDARAAPRADNTVDVLLVLAVDISYSMDPRNRPPAGGLRHRFDLPRIPGCAEARPQWPHRDRLCGMGGEKEQQLILPWHLVDGPESAKILSEKILAVPLRRAYRTSISGAIQFSAALFKTSGYKALRNVIDVSGDGVNNHGAPVTRARDEAVRQGITINGLRWC